MHCTYCSILKGTSQAEVTLNTEKIKPAALAIIELCWSEGIRQASRWAGRQAGGRAGGQAVNR